LIGVLLIVLINKNFVIKENAQKADNILEDFELISEKNKILEEQNINLKELNDEKNDVISIVSHDLKAPLNRVFALSNLIYLSSDNLTPDQLDYMNKMNIVVRDGLDLIRNLLDIRAIEFKGVQMNLVKVDLSKIIGSLVKSYTPYSNNKGQSIDIIKSSGPFSFTSDKQYLNRIFDNLMSNAVKFSPLNSTLTIHIDRSEDFFIVEVLDEGPGISIEDQSRLFKKYEVLSAVPTGGESSTGLGLSITKTLVEFLNGKIYYKNMEGNKTGATFVVELPVQGSRPES
jgi:signal transduction histidine kinase